MHGNTTVCEAVYTNTENSMVSPVAPENCSVNIQVWVVPYSVLRNHAGQSRYLSTEERARAARMLLPTDSRDFCVSRSFLRSVLASQMNCTPLDVDIRYSTYGKPFILNGPAFNLSHCKRVLTVAIADNGFTGQLGIDVETRVTDPNRLQLAQKCFTPIEQQQLSSFQTCASRKIAFTRGWTRKEAVVKAIGTGLRSPLSSFDVSLKQSRERSKVGRCADRQSLLLNSELEGISLKNCDLYDLGSYYDCELSLAVVNNISVGGNTVQVNNVDKSQLHVLTEFYHE